MFLIVFFFDEEGSRDQAVEGGDLSRGKCREVVFESGFHSNFKNLCKFQDQNLQIYGIVEGVFICLLCLCR